MLGSTIHVNSDRDANILSRDLMKSTDEMRHKKVCLRFDLNTTLSSQGAKMMAEALRCIETEKIYVSFSRELNQDFVDMVVQIIYLDGNQPEIVVQILDGTRSFGSNSAQAQFRFECFRLHKNDERLTAFTYYVCNTNDPVLLKNCMHGNTQVQVFHIRVNEDESLFNAALPLAEAICHSQVSEIRIIDDSGFVIDEQVLRILFQKGFQASGRVFKSLEILGQLDDASSLSEILSCVQSLCLFLLVSKPQLRANRMLLSLSGGLQHTKTLTSLTLLHYKLNDQCMMLLGRGIRNNKSVTSLLLQNNEIGDSGVIAFFGNWQDDSILESLALPFNRIGPVGAERIVTALTNSCAMASVNLSNNPVGDDGLRRIGELLLDVRLRTLNLSWYYHSSDDKAANQRAGQSLLRGMQNNYALVDLTLDGHFNYRGEVRVAIRFYEDLNASGRNMMLIADLPPTVWCHILALCKQKSNAISIIFYFLTEQPHLVNPSALY
jgi:hypothetical protein